VQSPVCGLVGLVRFLVLCYYVSDSFLLPRNIANNWKSYIGQICKITVPVNRLIKNSTILDIREQYISQPSMPRDLQLMVREDATRMGSLALLAFAAMSLLTGICVPQLVNQENQKSKILSSVRSRFQFTSLSLRSIWMLSHLMFAICISSTLLITTVRGTTIIVGTLGISWGMTCWVPYALISTELSRLNSNRWQLDGISAIEVEEYETQPGIIVGLHNMAIAAPQLVSTIGSSAIFWMWNQEGGQEYDSVAWVLRAGAISALIAAYLATKLGDPGNS
jgi:solute carrier family 45 protein 1/2/4